MNPTNATHPTLTILIATYNRCEVLRRTLEYFCSLDYSELDYEIIIVDNNSSDNTQGVVTSFENKILIRYLFQPIQGKSAALNLALDTSDLKDLVIFTDDDIVPRRDWLQAIAKASSKNTGISVFGGRVELLWPNKDVPTWIRQPEFEFVFCPHRPYTTTCAYSRGKYPTGANFWIRRQVLLKGFRFEKSIGALSHQAMGEDACFLLNLYRDGFKLLYIPDAVVEHRVDERYFARSAVLLRSFRMGRAIPHKELILNDPPDKRASLRLIASVAKWFLLSIYFWVFRFLQPTLINAIPVFNNLGNSFERLKFSFKK